MGKVFNNEPLHFKLDPQYQEDLDQKRIKNIISFMACFFGNVLDIGEKNRFGEELAEKLKIRSVQNTIGDLDISWEVEGDNQVFSTVWVFEIIEHLKNPDLFLRTLKQYCHEKTKIFLMYPHRYFRAFWCHNHFHELDTERFEKLVVEAGYKIVNVKHVVLFRDWKFYVSGIRPLLRLLFAPYNRHYYELRVR